MNKITCNVCGTSYPENAAQCPICGFAHAPETVQGEQESTYTYVKGGRFSKANVRKRNHAAQKYVEDTESDVMVISPKKEKTGIGSVIVIIVLILAILAVVSYIALRFFLPNNSLFEGLDNFTLPTWSQNEEDPGEEPEDSDVYDDVDDSEEYEEAEDNEEFADGEEELLECESIVLNETAVTFGEANEIFELIAGLEPVDTTDTVSYTSSNTDVATVDNIGIITAVGEGEAVITVTCGAATAECKVSCSFATEAPTTAPLALNRKEITFEEEGDSWILYDGNVALSEITWSSDDNEVATIENGKVVAVGAGDTTVYAIYNGNTTSCIIHCNFTQDNGGNSGVGEADGDSDHTYKLHNPYGRADDVTIKVGSEFPLTLVDEDKNEVKDATWKVEKSKICSYNKGKVKGLAAGTSKVTATYEGVKYTCIVRVK